MQKVQLHSHTTRSDGKLSPKELLYAYAEENFDLVAITDHRIYNRKNYAPETGVEIIPGMEIDARFDVTPGGMRHLHTLVLGLDDDANGYAQVERVESAELDEATSVFLKDVFEKLSMTGRSYDKILRIALTVSDLSGHKGVTKQDIAEALQYRSLDRKYWRR